MSAPTGCLKRALGMNNSISIHFVPLLFVCLSFLSAGGAPFRRFFFSKRNILGTTVVDSPARQGTSRRDGRVRLSEIRSPAKVEDRHRTDGRKERTDFRRADADAEKVRR